MSYLEALDRELADLAPDERADLLDEVEASLAEIEGDPEQRFGPANRFADELRASAGLPPAPSPGRPRRSLKSPLTRAARELAPIWWVVRAYVATLIAAQVFAAPFTSVSGIPRFHNAEIGALILAAAIVASIALGLVTRRRRNIAVLLVDLALLAVTLLLVGYEIDRRVLNEPRYDPAPTTGLVYDGSAINNVYVYDRKGRLLHDVQLYDEYGRPLSVRSGDRDRTRRIVRTRAGNPVFNTFPIRYYERGTTRVKDPDADPPNVKPPSLR